MEVYRAQLGALVAGLIAAMIFLVLMPDARAKPERPVEKDPGNVPSYATDKPKEGLLAIPEPLIVAQVAERLARRSGATPPDGNAFPAPKTMQGAGKMHRAAPAPAENNEVETAPPPKTREKAPPSEAAALPPLGSCDDPLTLVDRNHPLPQGYAPTDMVSLDSYGVRTLRGGTMLRREAAENLALLMEAAGAAGEDLIVASAYRSYDDQGAIHTVFVNFYGEEAAKTISAPPGHSEHQLGTTVDFTNHEAQYRVWSAFESTSAYGWLLEHAGDYGFVQSYERGKEQETGYQAESWHYRYIGMEHAQHLKSTGLSLQVFLVREGTLPRCR
jgi:D-alanyl-D-alanine carboxypeptidase